ncbi:MAG: vWA domain-containing protein [Desulfobacteraceae bacterium]|jgi:hypothetical protein
MMIHLFNSTAKTLPLLFFLLTAWFPNAWAEDDFIIILDQSASMREIRPGNPSTYQSDPLKAPKSSEAAKAINDVVTRLLKHNDYFALITFGNKAEIIISQQILHPHERKVLQRRINALPFKDSKTDIIASIKTTEELITSLGTPQRRKILVLITDGRNDPPDNSPFKTPQQQEKVFEKFRQSIELNSWNVNLVGFGLETDIRRIAANIGLTKDQIVTMDDLRIGKIRDRLQGLFEQNKKDTITLIKNEIKVDFTPKFFGGYHPANVKMQLISTYDEQMTVEFSPDHPIVFEDTNLLSSKLKPLSFNLPPNRPKNLYLELFHTGNRPDDGHITTYFQFHFTEESNRFYPWQGNMELNLPSWWEIYSVYAIAALCCIILLTTFIGWKANRAQVPQLRITVTSDKGTLGEPLTLRKGEVFSIANGHIHGYAVPAKGLTCRIAAKVKYLGRRKFEVVAREASIAQLGGTIEKLVVKMDIPFTLMEKNNGKKLRNIILSVPGRHGDVFGNGQHSDPF